MYVYTVNHIHKQSYIHMHMYTNIIHTSTHTSDVYSMDALHVVHPLYFAFLNSFLYQIKYLHRGKYLQNYQNNNNTKIIGTNIFIESELVSRKNVNILLKNNYLVFINLHASTFLHDYIFLHVQFVYYGLYFPN